MKPPPVDLRIDREGRWFADDREVVHKKIYKLFCDSLVLEDDGYHIRIDHMENPVTVEDAPFSVRTLFVENTAAGEDIIQLVLNDDRRVIFDPSTLSAPLADALYCTITDGRNLKARFSRTALQQFASLLHFDEDSEIYSLSLNGKKYNFKIGENACDI